MISRRPAYVLSITENHLFFKAFKNLGGILKKGYGEQVPSIPLKYFSFSLFVHVFQVLPERIC
jgi:hypothetical protein